MADGKRTANCASILFSNGVPESFVENCLALKHVMATSGSRFNPVEFLLEEVPGESPFKLPEEFSKAVKAARPAEVRLRRCTI